MNRIAPLAIVGIFALPVFAFASDSTSSLVVSSTASVAAIAAAETAPAPAPVAEEGNTMWPARKATIKTAFDQRRPLALPALYASLAALNAMDVYTTSQALKNGAREANPAVASMAGNSGASIAFKAATTASTIFFAERLWKKNRVAAIVTVAAINGVTAAVVANNARNARR